MRKTSVMTACLSALLMLSGTAIAGGDAAAGKGKAATCAGCHGANGEGVAPNPPLKGVSEADIVKALQAYKSGERDNPIMQPFSQMLSDQDMMDLGAYYASMK